MKSVSEFFVGIDSNATKSTALGIYCGIEASLEFIGAQGRTFAIQGLGKVGEALLSLICSKAEKIGIKDTVWRLPFVYVYERSDFSISFYAFQIYPATIRKALQNKNLNKYVTGKFTVMTKYDKKQNQYIEINVELMRGVKDTVGLKDRILKSTVDNLLKESSEYRETYKEKGDRVYPKIILWPYEHNVYFRPGVKQKWVKK